LKILDPDHRVPGTLWLISEDIEGLEIINIGYAL
jgi:hypothetical protein